MFPPWLRWPELIIFQLDVSHTFQQVITSEAYPLIQLLGQHLGASLTQYHISKACDGLADPPLFRAIFLTAFYAFLRISNIAPHSVKAFDPTRHFLRQDLIFHYPGAHLLVKWTKTLQDNRSDHLVQLPKLEMCISVQSELFLYYLLLGNYLQLLLYNNFPTFTQVIDTHVRDALRKVLTLLDIPHSGHGFHTFRRSGATFAFHHNAS